MKQRKGRKPKCYESYRYNVCLGRMTRKGTVEIRCQKCKWLEESAALRKVSHWMELPEPPGEGDEG